MLILFYIQHKSIPFHLSNDNTIIIEIYLFHHNVFPLKIREYICCTKLYGYWLKTPHT